MNGIQSENIYLVIEKGSMQKSTARELAETLSKKEELGLAYIVHAGFRVPDNKPLAEILAMSGKQAVVKPVMIDGKARPGDNYFSPTGVFVEITGTPHSIKVADSYAYVSQIPADIARIEQAYRELLPAETYERFVMPLLKGSGHQNMNLGELLRHLHASLLRQQLKGPPNVEVREMQYSTGNGLALNEHNTVYIAGYNPALNEKNGLQKAIAGFMAMDRYASSGELAQIIIPQNPQALFRVGNCRSLCSLCGCGDK